MPNVFPAWKYALNFEKTSNLVSCGYLSPEIKDCHYIDGAVKICQSATQGTLVC